jgi:hypothetical protein
MYLVRTKFPAGFRLGPGRHPHDRVATVLSGTLYVGFGEHFNAHRVTAVSPGHSCTLPACKSHFLWAKEGDVLLQLTGNG